MNSGIIARENNAECEAAAERAIPQAVLGLHRKYWVMADDTEEYLETRTNVTASTGQVAGFAIAPSIRDYFRSLGTAALILQDIEPQKAQKSSFPTDVVWKLG